MRYIYIYTGILIHSYSVSVNTCWSQVKCIFGPQRLVAGSVPNPAKSWDICWEIHSLHWTKPLSQFLIVKPVESLILMVISYLLYIHTHTHPFWCFARWPSHPSGFPASSASSASCCLAQFFKFSLTSFPAWAKGWPCGKPYGSLWLFVS